MSIIRQLSKEFWFPLLVSLAWAGYVTVISRDESLVKVFITALGPTFFLVSWLIGQYFRVKKQVSTEQSFVKIEDKFKQLFNDIENQSKETIAFITGGDSFIYFLLGDGLKAPIAVHRGKYPMYDVIVTFVDLDCFNALEKHGVLGACEQQISLGTLYPGSSNLIQNIALNAKSYNITITARNGFFTQLLRSKKENGIFMTAIRVVDQINKKILFEQISENFGEVEW